ncbi:GH25 family lysozyme M1 (1,4-beta-N-acetylmuramidase) [Bradyrhizobium sp. USDA 4341]
MIVALLSCASAWTQEASQDEVDPRELRRFWIGTQAGTKALPAARYTLTPQERLRFAGVFGADLSHYSFDLSTSGSCATPSGYTDPKCSCRADWDKFLSNGIVYIYSKASDGDTADLSFPRFWSEMASRHAAKSMFRGAYHFLRPDIDAKTQAKAFLTAIEATNGKRPDQLPPALDIEWSNKRIIRGTPAYESCPANRRTRNDRGNYYCDMWYTKSADQIVALAREWIELVSSATGRPVILYTNPIAWWNPVLGNTGDLLTRTQAIWTSRYTGSGPTYDPRWTKQGGSPEWKMAPLPHGASYPSGKYTTAHFWQFSENGALTTDAFACGGKLENRSMDMNWLPINKADYELLFGVGK